MAYIPYIQRKMKALEDNINHQVFEILERFIFLEILKIKTENQQADPMVRTNLETIR